MKTPDQTPFIAHLDLDCFYVSVERTKNPDLIGKPVAVGGTPSGRGVVASASYEARKFGVRSAMPTGRALKLCPQLIVVRGHYSDYTDYSDRLYKRMCDFAPVIERASIDEIYMDFTGCEGLYGNDLPGLIKKLRQLVWDEFGLPCTIALASSKVVAKIAAGTVKPNGICTVPNGGEKKFLAPLPIDVIPGIGKKTAAVLRDRGFDLVSDIQAVPKEQVVKILGKHGLWIYGAANGTGYSDVVPDHSRKSISHEQTFAHNLQEKGELEHLLHELVADVCSTMRGKNWKTKTITLKLRYADFKTISRAESVKPTNDDKVVFDTVRKLFHEGYTRPMPLRLLGVRLSHFLDDSQMKLALSPKDEQRQEILTAVDKLRDKFGDKVIHLGEA
ncbi:MAG: DNA polymerase IV [Bacteroidota bacterium]